MSDGEIGTTDGARAFRVAGMSCSHCVAAVTAAVEQVDGVTGVEVDLERGTMAVRGEGYTEAALREAVDEAGYGLVA